MISHPHADRDASRDVTIVTVTRADQAQSIRRGIGKRLPLPPKVRCCGCVGDRARSQFRARPQGRAGQDRVRQAGQGGTVMRRGMDNLRLTWTWTGTGLG